MRIVKDEQLQFGEVDISRIEFDLRACDELSKLLMDLQHIYCAPELRSQAFDMLEEMIPDNVYN